MSNTPWRLIERDSGQLIVDRLEVADGFWSRFKGLQFRRALPAGTGLLLVPCASIHTFWMRFALDVIFLSDAGRVLEVRTNVRPWRMVIAARGTHAVLEVTAGKVTVAPGTWLQLETPGVTMTPPRSLRFLSPLAA